MIHDFFLVERAEQVRRLCEAASGNRIELPGRYARVGLSASTRNVLRLCDAVREVPLADRSSRLGWLNWRSLKWFGDRSASAAEGPETLLSAAARQAITDFERGVVRTRFGEDPDAAQVAAAMLHAVLQDHASFLGLKPLQVHSEKFPYEFLFPSHLNLYTALAAPRAVERREAFSEDQLRTLFRFLDEFEEGGAAPDSELVGVLTLAANRLPLASAAALLQRIMDLCSCPQSTFSRSAAVTLKPLRDRVENAETLLGLLDAHVALESSALSDGLESKHRIVPGVGQRRALPPFLAGRLAELQEDPEHFEAWARLLRRTARVTESGGVDADFDGLLAARPEQVADLMALVAGDAKRPPLPPASQRWLVRLIAADQAAGESLEPARYRGFAEQLAPRLAALGDESIELFARDFIAAPKFRQWLRESADSLEQRTAMVQRLGERAAAMTDQRRLLHQFLVMAVLDPQCNNQQVQDLGLTVEVLDRLRDQGFISTGQLGALLQDVRDGLPKSLRRLAAPQQAARECEGRLARLYAALDQERRRFAELGSVGNFGLQAAGRQELPDDEPA